MLLWLLIALFACPAPGHAQAPMQKAAGDNFARVPNDDPAMAAAIAKARAGLAGFLAKADRPADNQRNFSVKVKVPLGETDSEFLWLRPFRHDGEDFVGRVVNQPRDIPDLKYGDTLSFRLTDIADWSYLQDGKMIGNATACVLIARHSPQQRAAFLAKYRIDCER